MASDASVDKEAMIECFKLLLDQGGPELYDEFCKLEPVLAGFVANRARMMTGTMALRKVPRKLMLECHFQMLELAALCFHAMRLGHSRLWDDLIKDGQLKAIEATMASDQRDSLDTQPERHERKLFDDQNLQDDDGPF